MTAWPFLGTVARHGLPCIAVWSLYLAAFWPGILTEDSFEQWRDLVAGEFRGYHSPLQTLIHWILTRAWLSPVPIVAAQIAGLALVYCAIVREGERRGAGGRWLTATTAAFALLPANGFLVVTLWKDVPYTIALLGLVALALRVARAPKGLTAGATPWILAGTLAAVATFRHNGLPTAALVLGTTLAAAKSARGAALRVIGLAVGAVLLVQVGLFGWIGVQPFHPAFRDQLPIHQIAAGLHPGTAYDAADYQAIGRVLPPARWLDTYRCETVIPTLAAVLEQAREDAYRQQRAGLYRAWGHAWLRSPGVLAAHHACVSGLIWHPLASFYVVSVAIVPNGYGLSTQPRLPALHDALVALEAATTRLPWRPIVWGPALHLAVVLGAAVLVARRTRRWLAVLPFAPAVAHSLVLFAAIPSAEYRLQYPVVAVGMLAPLLAHTLTRPRA